MSTDTPTNAAEGASQKAKVRQIAVLVGIFLSAIIVAGVVLRDNYARMQAHTPAPAAPTPTRDQAQVDELARAAERLARFQDESAGAAPTDAPRFNRAGIDPTARTDSDPAVQQLLQQLIERSTTPQADSEARGEAQRATAAADKAISEPMGGAIAVDRAPTSAAARPQSAVATATAGNALPPGTIIEARSAMQISSDYPGSPCMARVTRATRFADGRVAVPVGTTILCAVREDDGPNQVLQGRVPLALTSLVLPDGAVVPLVDAAALDAGGIAAIPGKTKRHLLAQTAGVLAGAILGAAQLGAADTDALSARSSLESDAIAGAASQVGPAITRYLRVQPTVVPEIGTPVRIVLLQPLPLPQA